MVRNNGCIVFCAMIVYKKRKAEIGGFIGKTMCLISCVPLQSDFTDSYWHTAFRRHISENGRRLQSLA